MKNIIRNTLRGMLAGLLALTAAGMASAQNSFPAPGGGGAPNSLPAPGGPANGIGWNPGPRPVAPPPSVWGSPWYNGWNNGPSVVIAPSVSIGNTMNQGVTKVIACGYDAQGVWRVLPMLVSYQYVGAQYQVNVINAWNPWTDMWDRNLDVQAFNTAYILRGVTYDFYVVLPFGTFYFNLA
ncbi:MAG: hypothetical protein K2N88_00585 [Muribaculaceae bacterium]|nr:hypothetical protein [Muribaculaceae bacterium]